MTIAFVVNPALCPSNPCTSASTRQGLTRSDPGPAGAPNPPNAQVCLDSNPDAFFRFFLPRLAAP